MNKTTIIISLIISSSISFSEDLKSIEWNRKPMIEGNTREQEVYEWGKLHPGVMPPLTEEEKYELFTKSGMPLPGTGATLVDGASIQATPEQKKSFIKFNNTQKTKGYVERYNNMAVKLLSMPEEAEKEFQSTKLKALPATSTHLRETNSELPMNYSYKGVPAHLMSKNIGYAAEHTFVGEGWTGAVNFFIPTFSGVCAYHEINIKLTGTSAFIPKDIARYDINTKLTTVNVVGNENSGFVYEIEWWDNNFKRNLECASKDYKIYYLNNAIELAKQIDNNS